MISHKLNEIEEISDSITIIRDGRTIETLDVHGAGSTRTGSSAAWSAATSTTATHRTTPKIGEVLIEITGLDRRAPRTTASARGQERQPDHVRKGEIVGLAGLMGAGRTEFARSVFGQSYGQQAVRASSSCTARSCRSAPCSRPSTPGSPT